MIHILHHAQEYIPEMSLTAVAFLRGNTHHIVSIDILPFDTDTVWVQLRHGYNQSVIIFNQNTVVLCFLGIIIPHKLLGIFRETGMPETFCV